MKKRFLSVLLSGVIFISCIDFTSLAANDVPEMNTYSIEGTESFVEEKTIEGESEVELSAEEQAENSLKEAESSDEAEKVENNGETENSGGTENSGETENSSEIENSGKTENSDDPQKGEDNDETVDESVKDTEESPTETVSGNGTEEGESSAETDSEIEEEQNPEDEAAQGSTEISERVSETVFTYSVSNEQITITGYTGTETEIMIPDEIESYPVVTIGSKVFANMTALKSVKLGSNVQTLGSNAFNGCTSLEHVSLGDSLETIGSYAFNNCSALGTIEMPKNLTSVNSNAFLKSGITKVEFEAGMSKVPNYACRYMSKLEEIIIPESVTEIGSYAFSDCTSLKNIALGDSVTTLGSYTFNGCTSLESASWGNGLETIGSYAFNNCTALNDVKLNGVTAIGNYAFCNCSALERITMPQSLISVGSNAFQNSGIKEVIFEDGTVKIPAYVCQNMKTLETVMIPESVTEIGNYAFNGCTSLESISLHDSVKTLGNNVFYGCTSLKSINLGKGLEKIGNSAFYNCTMLSKIDLGSMTTIGSSAFCNCAALEEIIMPKSLTSIGSNAFQNSGIKEVTFEDGMLKIPAYACQNMSKLELVEIPESVTEIGIYGFNGCILLESISLHDSVTVLGSNAFYGCSSLKNVDLGKGLETIGSNAFYNCTVLAEIDLGNVTTIGGSAFYNCTALEKITMPKNLTSVGSNAFRNSGIKEVIFEDGTIKIPNNICQNMNILERVVIPKSVTEIGNYAFNGCISLDSISLEGITKIGSYAFSGCNSFETVTIADGVVVGDYGFGDCKAVTEIVVGDEVTLGAYAFRNCSNIQTIKFGKNILINSTAFYNVNPKGSCGDSLTWELAIADRELYISGDGAMPDYGSESETPWHAMSSVPEIIVFEEGITTVGSYAFKNLENIISAVLPDEMTQIGTEAFSSCDNLQYVEIPENVQVVGERAFDGCNRLSEAIFCGDAPALRSACLPNTAALTVHYPETATGWTTRILSRFEMLKWQMWDNTAPHKDAVLLLDISGSMSDKMDELKESATAFIKGLGGRLSNTRVAIVAYDSIAKKVTAFSTDRYYQSRQINKLESDGGTAYLAALNSAASLLESSKADFKSIILFSDGEPNDSKTDIYARADELRESCDIYTVGLLSSTSQRNVLVNVAGGEEHYFEASAVEELLQTFLNLVDNFGKSTDTTVEIRRYQSRYDLLAEPQTMCIGSEEVVSIIVTPGTKYSNVAKVALVQNGTAVLANATGTFNSIIPGALFKEGQNISSVLYDAEGREIESLTLKMEMRASYTVTYKWNDGTDRVYKTDTVAGGKTPQKPEDPVRDGYKFRGWYAAESCDGFDYFSVFNTVNRSKQNGDITLYAKWATNRKTLNLMEDAFGFTNSGTYFCASNYEDLTKEQRKQYKYEISDGDYAKLISGLKWYNFIQKSRVKNAKENSWGGSCFGMSSAVCLAKDGVLDISNFDSKYTNIGRSRLKMNTKGDADVGNVESMINYYMLMQNIGRVYNIRTNYSTTNESVNLENIVSKFKAADCVAVVTINLKSGDKVIGGHAVVGYDFKEDEGNNTYTFEIYDCSMGNGKSYPVTITKNGNKYSAECDEWEAAWYNATKDGDLTADDIFFKVVVTVDELENEVLLTAPSVTRGYALGSGQNSATYDLYTSFADFDITDGNTHAEVREGELVDDSTLKLKCFSAVNEIGHPSEYFFRLPPLSSGSSYEITPIDKNEKSYTTTVFYNHSDNGFFVSETTEIAGVITLSDTGEVKTEYGETVEQEIHVSNIQMETPWYYVNVEGEGNSFTIDAQRDKTTITSESATQLDITAEDDFNVYRLDQVDISQNGSISITSDDDRNCIIEKDGKKIIDGKFGYSVVFDSQQGTSVEKLTGVEKNSLIKEPDDPRRDGYIFEGWYKEKTCENAWNFATDRVTDNTILYAGWSLDVNYFVGVTFKVAGKEDQTIYLPKNSLIDVDSCPLLSEEFESQAWYLDRNYKKKWDFEKDTVTKDVTLYAKGKSCTVTFVTNCDTVIESCTVYAGGYVTKPNDPQKDGYVFVGWFKEEACENLWDFNFETVLGDMTLYAGWTDVLYQVTFDLQGHGDMLEEYLEYAKVKAGLIKKPSDPKAEGFTFEGWYKEAGCINAWDFDADIVMRDTVLYAKWKVNEPDDEPGDEPGDDSDESIWGDILPEDRPISAADIPNGLWIAGISNSGYTYTGSAVKPEIRVYDGSRRLTWKKDCTVNYKNNTKAAQSTGTKAPAVVVKGKGNYAGTETQAFSIVQKDISDIDVAKSFIDAYALPKNNKNPSLVFSAKYNGKALKKNKDYVLSVRDSAGKEVGSYSALGDYTLTVTGAGRNYKGTCAFPFTVTDKTPVSKLKISKIADQEYDGTSKTPQPVVKFGSTTLTEGIDYYLSYDNNMEVGTATVTVTGKNEYFGTRNLTFRIAGVQIKKAKFTDFRTSVSYTGSPVEQNETVLTYNGSKLTMGKDYDVSYSNNLNKGKATVTYTGIGKYTGTIRKSYSITAYNMASNPGGRIRLSDDNRIQAVYAKGGAKPQIMIYDGKTLLREGADYTLTCQNNTAVTTSAMTKQPTIIIKGKGNYTGVFGKKPTFIITAKELSEVTITAPDVTASTKTGCFKTRPVLIDSDGKTLKAGTDYEKNYKYTYKNDTKVTSNGTVVTRSAGEIAVEADIIPAGTVLCVSVAARGSNYIGTSMEAEYRVTEKSISTAKVTVKNVDNNKNQFDYTGREVTISQRNLTVMVGQDQLSADQYEILADTYKNNVNRGTASVQIRGLKDYGGTRTVKFRIGTRRFRWFWNLF